MIQFYEQQEEQQEDEPQVECPPDPLVAPVSGIEIESVISVTSSPVISKLFNKSFFSFFIALSTP